MRIAAAIAAFLLVMGAIQADAKVRRARAVDNAEQSFSLFGRGGGAALISEMRRHLDTNPTGWRRKWCGKFLDQSLRAVGLPGGGNLASAYARYGSPSAGPCIGCLAVWGHHVGVITAIDSDGDITVISGNHGRLVREMVSGRGGAIYRVP